MILSILFACSTETTPAVEARSPTVEPTGEVAEALEGIDAPSDRTVQTHYGAEFSVDEVVKSTVFLADPSPYEGQTVRVEGRVADVCQMKGCWMVLAEEDKSVRVLMKDHSFSVAKDGTGRIAQVEGFVEATEVSADFVKHLEEESENPDAMPEKDAAEGAKLYQIQATAVRFLPDVP